MSGGLARLTTVQPFALGQTMVMRNLIRIGLLFGLIATLFQSALSQGNKTPRQVEVGQLLVLTSNSVPENAEMVSYSLDRTARGLLMKPAGLHRWQGQFVILPSQAGETLQPVVTTYLKDGRMLHQELAPIRVSGRTSQRDGLITRTHKGRLLCVFNRVVNAASVRVVTADGSVKQVGHENNYFVLPPEINEQNFRSVEATTIHGDHVVLTNSRAVSLDQA